VGKNSGTTPTKIGNLEIKNRLVMTPMTRSLLIAEGTQPSAEGRGYIFTPGIYTDEHVEGWKKITSAVDEAGSHIFIQLMHVGRTSHPDTAGGYRTFGSSLSGENDPKQTT
jgi:N-ethylmaleimide reductase